MSLINSEMGEHSVTAGIVKNLRPMHQTKKMVKSDNGGFVLEPLVQDSKHPANLMLPVWC